MGQKMSCEQVNEAIAELRNEYREYRVLVVNVGLVPHKVAPDYCHDWAASGPLLEEMIWEQGYQIFHLKKPLQATEAIARAWLAWKTEAMPARCRSQT